MFSGMEMMFSKMLGMSPDELASMAKNFVDTVEGVNNRLQTIERKLDTILERENNVNTPSNSD